jgi:hypothetical protein
VPAVPAETLKRVYGERTADAHVEQVALFLEYWLKEGISRRLARDRALGFMPGRINAGNIRDLVSLLAKRGLADDFFELASPSIDWDGALRAFLQAHDVGTDDIRYYGWAAASRTCSSRASSRHGRIGATVVLISGSLLAVKLVRTQLRSVVRL